MYHFFFVFCLCGMDYSVCMIIPCYHAVQQCIELSRSTVMYQNQYMHLKADVLPITLSRIPMRFVHLYIKKNKFYTTRYGAHGIKKTDTDLHDMSNQGSACWAITSLANVAAARLLRQSRDLLRA